MAAYRFTGTLAPIVLFTYARPQHTLKVLQALQANPEAADSHLYIFCDGARPGASQEVLDRIAQTREVVSKERWCGQVEIIISPENKGLTNSIVGGVTKVVNEYGKVIVLEDDTEPCPYFLDFMNHALEVYANDDKVMHVSGYVAPIESYKNLPDTFLFQQGTCWGWGTWARAWQHFRNDAPGLLADVYRHGDVRNFNIDGSYPFEWHLYDNITGKLNTWNVKWQAVMFLRGGLGLHPKQSLVHNIGIDGTGENCSNEYFYAGPTSPRLLEVERIAPLVEHAEARAGYKLFNNTHFGKVGPTIPQMYWGHFKRRVAKLKRNLTGQKPNVA